VSTPPKIITPYGYTTEWARKQAAMNIKADPEMGKRVLDLLTRELGDVVKADAEMRRRYPEAFEEVPKETT
jgi:hypothetical protein